MLRGHGSLPVAFLAALVSTTAMVCALAADDTIGAVRDRADAAREYTIAQKQAFERKAQEELAALQQQIQALQRRVNEASGSTRASLERSLAELETKKRAAKAQLEDLRAASEATWGDIKAGVRSALDELAKSYHKAVSRLP